ncbi:hypothetical protein K1T73_07220 [Roseovarius sp. SCSIO 43702]|uniref:hypothetical protein n=1 Tax=Roseovarius sp. SCSIO 43702 TaxID=2823043 RepID=UPI001C73D07D|nr:hypothetical protein [Roseovarius sp. SCSIO 43702]QYX58146.1 hypothetical protein K1T73_07220 [Roseovarius sp. SCSIO 43702]
MDDTVLMRIEASPPRRVFALVVLLSLAFLLVYLGMKGAGQPLVVQAFLVVLALGALYLAQRLWRATGEAIELVAGGLRTGGGEWIAEMDEIERLDRGTFAFKPSNGFIVILLTSRPARWRPGMWWRLGRRVGVGGVTSAGQSKAMAEIIAARIAAREG